MPFSLEELKRPKTRWIDFDGHLAPMGVQVRFVGTEGGQRFLNRLETDGITQPTRDDPFKIAPGKERAFCDAVAVHYVIGWRGVKEKSEDVDEAQFNIGKMGEILAAFPLAFAMVMRAVRDENSFFVSGSNGSTPN